MENLAQSVDSKLNTSIHMLIYVQDYVRFRKSVTETIGIDL